MNSPIVATKGRGRAERIERFGAQLLRRGAVFIFGVLCLLVSLAFMTVALNEFLRSMAGSKIAALSIGGAYLCFALISLSFVGTGVRSKPESDVGIPAAAKGRTLVGETTLGNEAPEIQSAERKEFARQIDDIVAPVLDVLRDGGLERERAALVAGAAITKELSPLMGAAFAIAAGFILGRTLGQRQ
ncbi:MAG: hypothetical protein ACREDV_06875 [Methylocella sp.]